MPESRRRRRPLEPPPVKPLEVLEAALVPALGRARPNPDALPKLQTYETPEILQDGVNLDNENAPPPKKRPKAFDKKKAKRDPKSVDDINELLEDVDDDPRKNATRLDEIVGHEQGERSGQGHEAKAGHLYSLKVARAVRKVFRAPASIDAKEIRELVVIVKVKRMSADGELLDYKIRKKSGNAAYDAAALAAIQRFDPLEGGDKMLPKPDPDALRHVNRFGMRIRMDGARMSR